MSDVIRPAVCGHCRSAGVDPHCAGVSEAACPWVRCRACHYLTDWKGRTVSPSNSTKG